ncbi:MAG: hypothetical protein AB7G15_07330 [Alphaproteobacteria bacterium]
MPMFMPMSMRLASIVAVLLAAGAAGSVARAQSGLLVLEPHDVRAVCDGAPAPDVKRNHTFVQLGKITEAQRAACAIEVDFVFRSGTDQDRFRAQWAKNGYLEFMALGRQRPSFPHRVNAGEPVAGVTLGEMAPPLGGYRVRVALASLLGGPELTQAWLMIGNRFGEKADAKSYFSVSMHFDAGDPTLARKQAKRPGFSIE